MGWWQTCGFQRHADPHQSRRHLVETTAEPPAAGPEVAWHEAGHAIVGTLLGSAVDRVSIYPLQLCRFLPRTERTPHRHAAMRALSGPIAGRWMSRLVDRPGDAALAPIVDMIRDVRGGHCDGCQAMRAAVLAVGIAAPTAAVLAEYRSCEAATIRLVTAPAVTRAIAALADRLLAEGSVAGDAVSAIVARLDPTSLEEFLP